jgi:hypothetical protein
MLWIRLTFKREPAIAARHWCVRLKTGDLAQDGFHGSTIVCSDASRACFRAILGCGPNDSASGSVRMASGGGAGDNCPRARAPIEPAPSPRALD